MYTLVHSICVYLCCHEVVHLKMYSPDIEETDVESVSEGSADDLATLGDTSFFDFSFSAAKTDSLPFTIQDTGRTSTRKSHRVIIIMCFLMYFVD